MIEVNEQQTIHTGWGAPRAHTAPLDIREAVELWARQNRGTHGTIAWNPVMRVWQINFDLKDEDPRMRGWRDGRLKVKPSEPVYLHRQTRGEDGRCKWVALSLEELGVSGVLAWLDEGNTWSGTGKYPNFDTACRAADEHNENLRALMHREAEQNAGLRARDERKRLLGTPWTTVPADISALPEK